MRARGLNPRRAAAVLVAAVLVAAALAPAPAAAGLFGPDAPARIPIPAHDHRARIEDRAGVVVDVARVTFDGEVFVYGAVGLAKVTVAFADARTFLVLPGPDADHVVVRATLRSGATQDLLVEADRPVYGHAAFGNYRLDVGDLRRLDLLD